MLPNQIPIPNTCEKTSKKPYKNIYRVPVTKFNDKPKSLDGSNSVWDIQNYFEHIIKKETLTDKPPIRA